MKWHMKSHDIQTEASHCDESCTRHHDYHRSWTVRAMPSLSFRDAAPHSRHTVACHSRRTWRSPYAASSPRRCRFDPRSRRYWPDGKSRTLLRSTWRQPRALDAGWRRWGWRWGSCRAVARFRRLEEECERGSMDRTGRGCVTAGTCTAAPARPSRSAFRGSRHRTCADRRESWDCGRYENTADTRGTCRTVPRWSWPEHLRCFSRRPTTSS